MDKMHRALAGASCFVLAVLFLAIPVSAQPAQDWRAVYDGPYHGFDDVPRLAVDGQGFVYVTGMSTGAPNQDRYGDFDYATIKYDPLGNQVWVRRFAGPAGYKDEPQAILADADGNVYVTGYSWREYSHLPGGTEYDYTTIKYDRDGNQLWLRYYDGPIHRDEHAQSMAFDPDGNIVITGNSVGGEIGVKIYQEVLTVKYAPDGTLLWARRYSRAGFGDIAREVAVDATGNIYVVGQSGFDDGTGSNKDLLLLKYNPQGTLVWARHFDYQIPEQGISSEFEDAWDLTVDATGNVYAVGWTYVDGTRYRDFLALKYNANGALQWSRTFDGGENDYAYRIVVDSAGNVYVSGEAQTPGVPYPSTDNVTIKYSPSGAKLWQRVYAASPGHWDGDTQMVLAPPGGVYVAMMSQIPEGYNNTVVHYLADGTEAWSYRIPGNGNDWLWDLALDPAGDLIVGGHEADPTTATNFLTVKLATSRGTAPGPRLATLTISPTRVTGGSSATGTVTLDGPAPVGGAVVTAESQWTASAWCPASVTVPAGATSASFPISTSANVNQDDVVNFSASYGGVAKLAALTVAKPPSPPPTVAVQSITATPLTFPGDCKTSSGKVTLTAPAPAGGTWVQIVDQHPVATMPSGVTVPAGATSATFTISGPVVTSTVTGTVSASAGGVTKTVSVKVRPIAIASLTLSPNRLRGPASSTATVTLECPAAPGSISVVLSSSNTAVATPAVSSLILPAGTKTATFQVNTADVSALSTADIQARANGVTKTARITVDP